MKFEPFVLSSAIDKWVYDAAAEIAASKTKSGKTKSLNGKPRTFDEIYADSLNGLAVENGVFLQLQRYGATKGWIVNRSKVYEHDIELTIGDQMFLIDVKTVESKGKTFSIGAFEMRRANPDTLYLIFDISKTLVKFCGWTEKLMFNPSKFNDGGYVFWHDIDTNSATLPF